MIVEYRRYTLKPGCTAAFWNAQVSRGFEPVRPVLDRLLGYFEAAENARDEITHLYCFSSFDDWKARLHGLYGDPGLTEYFRTVRQLMTAQENKFLVRAPLDPLNPVVTGQEWNSTSGATATLRKRAEYLVEEITTQLVPGAMPAFWLAYEQCLLSRDPAVTRGLFGCFSTLVGPLHQVIHYRTHADEAASEAHANDLSVSSAWQRFQKAILSLKVVEGRKLLRPSPLPELSPLFDLLASGAARLP